MPVLLSALAADGQQPTPSRKIIAYPVSTSINIDGALDEVAWQQAPANAHFLQSEPHPGQPAEFDTEVKLLYNSSYLYIAAFCRDTVTTYRIPDMKRDFNEVNHEYFGISIDGFHDRRNAMVFITNPYGAQKDLLSFDDRLYDIDWDGLWIVRTQRHDSGWNAEIAIPWKTLRYKATGSTVTFGINFFRRRRTSNEVSAWSPFPWSLSPMRMDHAGTVEFDHPPGPRQNIRINPYLLLNYGKKKGDATGNSDHTTLKPGGEIKWLITPNNVLDLTVNTDFAQADVDRKVTNLTRFSVYFPERRQFFLENAGLFGAGLTPQRPYSNSQQIIPFFSRRIGLAEDGSQLPIDAGIRFVHRSIKQNAGVMLVQQHEHGLTPATTFAVGRYSRNFGGQHRIGGIITYAGNATGKRSSQDITYALDGFFRAGKYLSIQAMGAATANDGRQKGYAGFIESIYRSNKGVIHYTQSYVSERFAPKTGFVAQNDLIGTQLEAWPVLQGKWLPKFARYFEPGFSAELFHKASTGNMQQWYIGFFPIYIDFNSGGYAGLYITPSYQKLEEVFTPLKIAIDTGEYRYTRWLLSYGTDPSKKLSASFSLETGKYYNGRLTTGRGSLTFAPIPHIAITGRLEWNDAGDLGLARLHQEARLWSMEARLALNPRWQLTGFYQVSDLYATANYNIRFAWEYRPLSHVYLVYNRNSYPGATTPVKQEEQALLFKLSYLRQF